MLEKNKVDFGLCELILELTSQTGVEKLGHLVIAHVLYALEQLLLTITNGLRRLHGNYSLLQFFPCLLLVVQWQLRSLCKLSKT